MDMDNGHAIFPWCDLTRSLVCRAELPPPLTPPLPPQPHP